VNEAAVITYRERGYCNGRISLIRAECNHHPLHFVSTAVTNKEGSADADSPPQLAQSSRRLRLNPSHGE
jgi:hypothetical protein